MTGEMVKGLAFNRGRRGHPQAGMRASHDSWVENWHPVANRNNTQIEADRRPDSRGQAETDNERVQHPRKKAMMTFQQQRAPYALPRAGDAGR